MIAEAVGVGVAAGLLSGLFGVGGGIVFVPALVIFFDLGQVDAEATSLLAMVPVALVGAWRQRRYGNIEVGQGIVVGLLAAAGAVGGVVLANTLPEDALRLAFAGFTLVIAVQLVRRGIAQRAGR
jgi:uncharacterized protein